MNAKANCHVQYARCQGASLDLIDRIWNCQKWL